MGTTYSITILDFIHNKVEFKANIDKQLDTINQKFSTYIADSEISNINKSNAELIKLSDEFKYVLDKALYYCKLVNGNYDITIAPLVDLWGFSGSNNVIPSDDDIEDVMGNIGYEKISLNNQLQYF